MTQHVRKCPGCGEERPAEEVLCQNCTWDLTQEPLRLLGQIDQVCEMPAPTMCTRLCLNGHPLDLHDEMCFTCGAIAATESCSINQEPFLQEEETFIDGWTIVEQLDIAHEPFERFIVEKHGRRAHLTLYLPEMHPDPGIYEIFKRLPKDHSPELLDYGVWRNRRYEVTDLTSYPTLLDLQSACIDLSTIQQIVKSIGRIVFSLSEQGFRHGNLRPENIFIVYRDPLNVMLSSFHYSHLSAFDLDVVKQPISALYTAPEVIAGGVSAASDWWSLGMIILQFITNGSCFEGINEKAFRIHIVTRGISLPKEIDPSIHHLLRGLLAADPDQRWQWAQVQSWLAGEPVDAPTDTKVEETKSGPSLEFKEISYTCPKRYALIAAEASNWEQAKDLLLRGVIATWLEDRKADPKIIAGVRLASSMDSLHEDFRHALALMWMNPNLPLIYQGEIVTSSWMLQHPVRGYELINSPLIGLLRQMNRGRHLCDLHDREARARERAKALDIELNEESFRLLALASSRPNLERQWKMHRRLYPGADHGGLNALMDRQKMAEEDLLVLLGAANQQYQPLEQILSQAKVLAAQAKVSSYEDLAAREWFEISRRDLYREIEERTANYARCGIVRIDEWIDDFRIERRISLPRALVLLSIPRTSWQEPHRQQYVSTILEFFEKRTASLAQRGPLVRMLIGKSSSRIDLAGIAAKKPTASTILEHLISRIETPLGIDRVAFEDDLNLERRLRHLVSHATTYRRDTGIDSLYLGFPFLVMQDHRAEITEKKPRIAPILLWPIKIDMENGGRVSIHFDRDREEIRVNPALAGMMDPEEARRWTETAKELLGRSAIRIGDVMDAFGFLADPRERTLCLLPGSDYKVQARSKQVVCSAVFFHAEFMGQAIGEDLRQMKKMSPAGTGLETALRVNKDSIALPPLPPIFEKERFFTMESDPSQEKAVFRARQPPGLLIEGPPGTGKSQTIVNIIADSIGRKQTVLVVCQKSAALEVLAKRLDAEGLKNRYFYITNVNKDRISVLQSLRAQIEGIGQAVKDFKVENVEREREELAEKIEKLEKEIDKHHAAIHRIDETTGLSYRILLGQLIDLEEQAIKLVDVPALRRLFKDLDQKQLTVIEETCSPIAGVWLESAFEGNPLDKLRLFSSDAALVNEFTSSLFALIDQEKRRDDAIRQDYDSHLSPNLIRVPTSILKKWLRWAKSAAAPVTFFSRLNPIRYLHGKWIQKVMTDHNETPDHERIIQFQNAVTLELQQRPHREANHDLVKAQSIDALDRLEPFFCVDFFDLCQTNIQHHRSNLYNLQLLVEGLPSLSAYQEFRLQSSSVLPEAFKTFATLREKEKELREYPPDELGKVVQRIIAREARLAWKDRIEQSFPILRLAQKELSRKIQTLDKSMTKMRKLNQKFLSLNLDIDNVRRPEDWEDITRLRGPRARRLREVIERGWDMGLGSLRPVWLMNPDTASQLLPLRAGMFDVIIFDEASQIPIENALSTLFRAKRIVISGDEKQMPPTSLFVKRIGDDEESASIDEDLDEMISEVEREALEDTWDRREIKDCSDLLALGKTVLPRSMLQIHYRSKYRELMAFSNAAFYGNQLNVPVRHPDNVIQHIRPIELIRVDGVYANQTNREEAERVVAILAEWWSLLERPTIGVVTFNAKQADLIEDLLAERADQNASFREALDQERERKQGGEDMGFFVKNVENVQGDEREVIIFSSTFGRDEKGGFRRQFGLLSQTGGERRLNVAITRAKEKIILITSLPIHEISDALSKSQGPKNSRDYLQAYFEYASKLSEGSLEAARKTLDHMASENPSVQESSKVDKDGFTRSVAAFITSLGLNPLAIKENDAFGLDFVIEDPERRRFGIGIECDAHCHPVLEKARAREIWRPKVLHMGIPYVHRVTSYAWYHRRNEEMERLKKMLEEALRVMFSGEPIRSVQEDKRV